MLVLAACLLLICTGTAIAAPFAAVGADGVALPAWSWILLVTCAVLAALVVGLVYGALARIRALEEWNRQIDERMDDTREGYVRREDLEGLRTQVADVKTRQDSIYTECELLRRRMEEIGQQNQQILHLLTGPGNG